MSSRNGTTRRLVVITAGMGVPSSTRLLADRLAEAAGAALRARGIRPEIEVVELRELAHEITDHLLTGLPQGRLREVVGKVAAADGLIAVTPVFNASFSGLFKSFFDALDRDAVAGKPVLIGATGGSERHSLVLEHAMRPMFAYLHAIVAPTAVYAASADWGPARDGSPELIERAERAGGELADLVSGRLPSRRTDPDLVPFEELVSGG